MRARTLLMLVGLALVGPAAPAATKGIVADVDDHLVEIRTDFAGQDILVFGAIDGPGDVILVMRGPAGRVAIHQKERFAGIWVNAESIEFDDVPSLYGVASSRPLFDILPNEILDRYQLGVGRLQFETAEEEPYGIGSFRIALVQQKRKQGLYADRVGRVTFIGETLFRANLHLPSNVPTGTFLIDVYLARDGRIVDAQNMPLVISKVGFGADLYKYANSRSVGPRFGYGIAAVLVSLLTGWLAHLAFRKR
ncbi:MAG TPA: TIGR02186 family protein [Dongiaceae bacterium]|nr:TIGR02186 family protein [Dongiaceae bacterium]